MAAKEVKGAGWDPAPSRSVPRRTPGCVTDAHHRQDRRAGQVVAAANPVRFRAAWPRPRTRASRSPSRRIVLGGGVAPVRLERAAAAVGPAGSASTGDYVTACHDPLRYQEVTAVQRTRALRTHPPGTRSH